MEFVCAVYIFSRVSKVVIGEGRLLVNLEVIGVKLAFSYVSKVVIGLDITFIFF